MGRNCNEQVMCNTAFSMGSKEMLVWLISFPWKPQQAGTSHTCTPREVVCKTRPLSTHSVPKDTLACSSQPHGHHSLPGGQFFSWLQWPRKQPGIKRTVSLTLVHRLISLFQKKTIPCYTSGEQTAKIHIS